MTMHRDFSKLSRPIHIIPEDVRKRLEDRQLWETYRSRPPYQQNDYIGWILKAKRPETREKRINQMLEELEIGSLYMNMDYKPSDQ